MTDPEKVAADIVGQYAAVENAAYLPKLTAEVASALRAARNEGLEEAAVIADRYAANAVDSPLNSTAESIHGETAGRDIASAIRSKKDAGNA